MTFLYGPALSEAIKTLVKKDVDLDCAVAFWGKGAESWFPENGKKKRIVCNLSMGGTNPKVIRDLLGRKDKNLEIWAHDRLHAKVYIGKESAIVGSANASANGLGFEGAEAAAFAEAGASIADAESLSSIRTWFNTIVRESIRIDSPGHQALKDAEAAYRESRRNRPNRLKFTSLLEVWEKCPEALSDRDIFLVIMSDDASDKAWKIAKGLVKSKVIASEYDFYESAKKFEANQTYIDIHVDGNKGTYGGIYKSRDPELKASRYTEGTGRKKMTLQLVDEIKELPYSLKFSKEDKKTLAKAAALLLHDGRETSRTIRIDEFLQEARDKKFLLRK